MTREEKQKVIDALKISAPVKAVTQEEFNDYIQTLNKIMDWLEQEPCETQMIDKSNFSQEQYKADLQCAYDCGKASVKPCEDAISRQAALNCLTATKLKKFDFILHAREEIKKLPSVNPQKSGHWIKISPAGIYECSECGQNVMTSNICAYRFCHGCSAKMVESQESEK